MLKFIYVLNIKQKNTFNNAITNVFKQKKQACICVENRIFITNI